MGRITWKASMKCIGENMEESPAAQKLTACNDYDRNYLRTIAISMN
jgi:hypothetical protein